MDTEVINRYIRMGSTSSNDSSLSEDQNKSTFEDETVSFTDGQEMESIQDNYAFDETSERFSVSSAIEQSTSINQQNVLDDSNNVCTLIHCSQKDDTDLSICSDSELEDVTEDSIVADEYSVTPGKQRLFDLRVTKQSLRAKALVASAPFMDRIEETTTPVVSKVLNSPLILNDTSYRHSEINENLNVLSITEIRHGTSIEHFNQTSNENVFETSKFIDETAGELLISTDLKNDIVSVNKSADTMFDETMNTNKHSTDGKGMNVNKSLIKTDQIENTLNDMVHTSNNKQFMNIMTNIVIPTDLNVHYDKEYLIAAQINAISTNTSVDDKIFDTTMKTNILSTNNQSTDSNKSLNDTEHKFEVDKSVNIMANMAITTSDVNDHHKDEEFSVAMDVDIKSANTSVDKELDETVWTRRLSLNNQSTDSNKSLNETDHKFDGEKSMNIMSNIANSISGVDEYNDVKNSIATEVGIISISSSVVDKIFDETVYTNKLSTNNQSMDTNKSLNDSNIENTLNVTEHNFDGEKSMNIMSNMVEPTSDVDNYNDEEFSVAMEVDIKSTNTSCVDNELDETMCSNWLSINIQSTDSIKSLNETNIKNTLNDTEYKFDGEKSMNIRSNMAVPTSDVNDEEFSVTMEVDIKSTNTSGMDKELNETVCTNTHSINNQRTDSIKSLNETNIKNTLNDAEYKFDGEKSMNVMSNITNSISSVDEYNDGENSIATEVCNISINTLSTNNKSMDMNKSLNETNIENTSNVTEHKFDCENSINIRSNMAVPTSDVNDEEFSVTMEVDIKSTNTSCMDKELNETVCTNTHSINNQRTDSNKSLNETNIINTLNVTEHKFDGEKSMNIMSNEANPLSSAVEYNDGENLITSDVDIIPMSTSVVDKLIDETVYPNTLSTNNQSMDMNKSLNETNIENTSNVTEHKFDGEKSMKIMSNIPIPLPGVNGYFDKENSIATKVDIKSINTSIVDKIFDESMLINANKLLTDSRFMNCNKSLNETESILNNTEHRFVNNIQNTSVSAVHFDEKLHLSKLDKSILKNTINSDNSFVGINDVNITCNTSLEDPSCMMRQYLDFEQTVNEMCNDISSANGPVGKSNKPKESYDDETLENLIEQTLSSDTFNLTKVNENVSNYNGSNLSVIIENKSLETSCNNIEQNEDFVIPNNDVPITLESESIVKEVNDIELLNKSTVVNTVATPSKSEVGLAYGIDVNNQIKTKESISINCNITDSGLVENINESKRNGSSMLSDELSKTELDTFTKVNKNFNNTTTKQIFISEDAIKIHSTQNTLDENNLYLIADQINITDIPNSTAFKLIPETEITQKNLIDQHELLNNDNQQQDLLDATKCIDNSLEEFTNLEQMFNFGDNIKGKQVEYKTPKTQKLLDFSIIQQTPTFDNPSKKQKLLNFSIVDQTPILLSTQKKYPIDNVINDDSLINFSSVDQMWNSEVVTKDEINFKDLHNSSNYSSSNNLSTISAPDLELLADESIKRNTSNFSNSSFDQTITDSNLNLSTYSCASKTQNVITELNNLEPLVLINKQIVADKPSDSLNQTVKLNESRQKTFYDKHCVAEASTKVVKPDLKLLSNTTSNQNIDSAVFKDDSNQDPCFNSNERAIVDFSIIHQGLLENVELKNNTAITSFESDRNVSNLIEMSFVTKSEEQTILSSENPIIPITSHSISENSIQSRSDEMNSTALHLEESTFLHNNTELLTDIQMKDESLLIESPEKSSIIDSFHSIELDHVQEDNKRKMETTQEYDNNEKKMKVETEMLKTPMSMLYKIKNMFRSSERQPSCVNNTKENNLKSNKCYQKLNFNKFEENNEDFTKRITLKKPEVIRSKIPCKVTDRSLIKNDEFNSSSLLSLNDSIKQKKTIPKLTGVPVLSDVSNSSNRKCAESRIPSKFQK
ncbi:protein PF3D7_1417600-like isoform X2 [Metopolophium dirhodum]|nr:protein PF3D7_1417600-like isoform X2 [Metopolophium dirhodum]